MRIRVSAKSLYGIDAPGVHGRVHVAKVPFVCRDLAVGLHVPLAREEIELLLRERRVDERERDAVERRVPSREERVFPPTRSE